MTTILKLKIKLIKRTGTKNITEGVRKIWRREKYITEDGNKFYPACPKGLCDCPVREALLRRKIY